MTTFDEVSPNKGKAANTKTEPRGDTPTPVGPRYFNRELSWLEFNGRVLEEALDETWSVLEQLKFLCIFSTNLDEFFMIRVSGLKEQNAEGIGNLSHDGMTPAEQIAELSKRLRPMLKKQAAHLTEKVLPALTDHGITIEPYDGVSAREKKALDKYFHNEVFPILTPQSVDSSHPFPYVSNLSLNLGLYIEPDRTFTQANLKHLFKQKRFIRLKLPPSVPRLIPIGRSGDRYALLEQVVAANIAELFPHMKASQAYLFRVTRDADIEIREDEAGDLLRSLERELQRPRDRFAVRLEVAADMPEKMVRLLAEGTGVSGDEVERVAGIVNVPSLMELYSLDRPLLKQTVLTPGIPDPLRESGRVFDAIRKGDILLHHPYTAFTPVSNLIGDAAEDPAVQAIKICLYRPGKDSPTVNALIRASRMGKEVTAVIELKARFDEGNNIEWARRMENEGVNVVYGVASLKIHCKILMVVRKENGQLARYVHLASGNYNPVTALSYTDVGLLTADDEIAEDVTSLFNFLTGYSRPDRYRHLIVAPHDLRERLILLIRRERTHREGGREARIILKANAITDVELIDELYLASQAGVTIDLIIRGICTLRPGIRGLSDNITVRSVVGRFLEHSRIAYFMNSGGKHPDVYIGSSDLMHRSFDRRVEVMAPVLDPAIRTHLRETVLEAYLNDQVNTRVLQSDGTYKRVAGRSTEGFDVQAHLAGTPTTAS